MVGGTLLLLLISCNLHRTQGWNNNLNNLSGNFAINHRHGASYRDDMINKKEPTNTDEIEKTLTELSNILVSTERESKFEARLWKRLGKLLLDAGEYAEASRTFRRGAERCPADESLTHHLKVYNAFHADTNDDLSVRGTLPPLDINRMNEGIFLTLDVPTDAIPEGVISMAKSRSGNCDLQELSKLLNASKEPILSKSACEYIIDATKKAAAKIGWTKNRHLQAPTCDIPAFDLDIEVVHWLKDAMTNCLFPLLSKAFPKSMGISHGKLHIQDMFVVRYDADNDDDKPGFKHLKPHEDESIISLTVALNDMDEYDGGGLFIASTGDLLNGDAGTVLGFAGGIVHGGYPVTRGTRWILTVFLYIDENSSGKKNGYILEQVNARVEDLSSRSK